MNLADIFSLKDDTKPNNITVRLLLLRIMREYKLSMITLKVALHFPNHEDLMLEKKSSQSEDCGRFLKVLITPSDEGSGKKQRMLFAEALSDRISRVARDESDNSPANTRSKDSFSNPTSGLLLLENMKIYLKVARA